MGQRLRPDADMARDRARYAAILEEYVAGGGEAALRDAYETGRAAFADGLGVVEVAAMYHGALTGLLRQNASDAHLGNQILERANEFFSESLFPYEMALRGFQEAVSAQRRMNEMLEQEIHRLAHAVHDEAGQLLVVARLAIAELTPELSPSSQGRIQDVSALLDRVEQQLRRLSHDLRPTILDDLGLVPAVRALADSVSARTQLLIHVESVVECRHGRRIETAAYRVIHEALTNAVKHGHAKYIYVQVAEGAGHLCCVVRDDGVGFELSGTLSQSAGGGLGLVGMRERLSAVGGTLQIESEVGRGTVLHFKIPIER